MGVQAYDLRASIDVIGLSLDEFQLIEHYFSKSYDSDTGTILGIGDDCAVLAVPPHSNMAISIDTLVEGVHFPTNANPHDIAQRALCVSVSDLAAMGAKPLWFTLALTLPSLDQEWLAEFSRGLFSMAENIGIRLVGGDTTKGPLTISIQVHGAVKEKGLSRAGAKAGDYIFVTGPLGDGAAALSVILGQSKIENQTDADYLYARFYQPCPMIADGLALINVASTAIDISDGLLADLGHICKSSNIGAHINIEKLPLSGAIKRHFDAEQCRQWALSGGDDYQLCFTLPRENEALFLSICEQNKRKYYEVGKVVEGEEIRCFDHGKPWQASSFGFQHFN